MMHKKFEGFYNDILHDPRIEKRVEKVMTDMFTFGKAVINKFCNTNTEKIGAYRMFSNESFSHEDLIRGTLKSCITSSRESEHLLCLQDTTELNFTHHINRIGKGDKDIGPVTNDSNAGFYCHPMLIVDAQNIIPIGFSYIKLWNRLWDKKNRHERNYQSQRIEEKESYRWIDSALKTKETLPDATMLTVIGDREADIYEELALVPDKRTHLLIRSSINRRIKDSDKKLFEVLDSEEQKTTYELELKGNKKRKNRIAKMSLKYTKVKIQKPSKKNLQTYPDFIELWAIEARELKETVPAKEDPVLWRLLTTHEINSNKDALKYIGWYSKRWLIEELFRIIKSKGFEIESSQLETGAALKKLLVLTLQSALLVMQLKLTLNTPHSVKANLSFTQGQIEFIQLLHKQIEGKTLKQQNPYSKESLAWCTWLIARLSGWSGYQTHGPPGYISLKNGLDIFYNKYDGYRIAISGLLN